MNDPRDHDEVASLPTLREAAGGPLVFTSGGGAPTSADMVARTVAEGHFGFKTGQGFYTYPTDQAGRVLAERDERYLALLKLLYAESQSTEQPQ